MNSFASKPSSLNFCIYGLGSTGESVAKYLKKKNFLNVKIWDDKIKLKNKKKKIFRVFRFIRLYNFKSWNKS